MTIAATIMADFKTLPYIHQLIEFGLSAELKARALLWNMRTGKTKVIIDTACHLYKAGKIDAVLIIAPNGVHENWIHRELPRHHWDTVPYETLFWDTDVAGEKGIARVRAANKDQWELDRQAWWKKARTLLATQECLPWFSIAAETMARKDVRKLVTRITKRRKNVFVIFDESHDFRTPGSKRSMMARAIAKRCAYRRILSGTVTENSPLNAWAQYELLEHGALGFDTFGAFEAYHAYYEEARTKSGRSYKVLKEYRHLKTLRKRMAPYSSVVLRSDCEDLPDLIRERHAFDLTPKQTKIYKKLLQQFTVELQEGQIVSIGEKTQKLIKLQQVVSGFLKDEYGKIHKIPGKNPRLEALLEEVRMAGGKCIIWCAFKEDMRLVTKTLLAHGRRVLEYHGGTSVEDKRKVREAFSPGSKAEVDDLVGHPKSGGQGLDLSAAMKIIWYSHTFDAIIRSQADERATAIGGKNIPVIDLVAPGVDMYILDKVTKKVSIADALVREGMQEVLQKMEL